ncbi:hypothetical protein [Clostridium estertheticum]|uniref:hypothetical protein n=1 Tax=Clostridium estertheticum TaxID=238834 RepID=UPI001C0DA5A4|nr:hypothetical protein [Clostridium estertheticum]MBU3171373.1 hypothetical protein [Clostridium estertheticum]
MDKEQKKPETIKCGIIMPISAIDGYPAEHWLDVKNIFVQAASSIVNYDFNTIIVSEAEDVGIIQKRIIQNLYNSDIVICDVSGKNPNVMFELGMRLAFDKATIIVKDNQTDYSFDTGIIEHLEYPRDLRFSKIVEFKTKLSNKLVATLEESRNNTEYSTFLKSFGQFKVASLNELEVSPDKAILESIDDLRREVYLLGNKTNRNSPSRRGVGFPKDAVIEANKVIEKYFEETGATSLDELIKDVDLYRKIMDEIDAPRYFPKQIDYKKFYDSIISAYNNKQLVSI